MEEGVADLALAVLLRVLVGIMVMNSAFSYDIYINLFI
jgi:hypothetical protein